MHPEVDNRTPLPFELLFLADEEGHPLAVLLAQATLRVEAGRLVLAEEQAPIALAGEPNPPRPEAPGDAPLPGAPPSWRLEPEVAFMKPAVDVILLGHACAPGPRATSAEVVLRVGKREKTVRATGDRVFVDRLTGIEPSAPRPFERIPLQWEYAFGGADPSVQVDPLPFEPRNPIGRGFRDKRAQFVEGLPLPNLEDPSAPLTRWRQVVPPAGFGFLSGGWAPRSALSGTYDEQWSKTRSPYLPKDFDRRFFNGAPADQVLSLKGNEAVEVLGVRPQGGLRFALPDLQPLAATLHLRDRREALAMPFDTLVIDADAATVRVLFRAHARLERGAHDVEALQLSPPSAGRLATLLTAAPA